MDERSLARFMAKVTERDQCWVWQGSRRSSGQRYGGFRIGDKVYAAHRASYEHFRGPIPRGLYVCHHCDNHLCVNPEHLFLGDQLANMADMRAKGRSPVNAGVRNPRAKLNPQKVLQAREHYRDGAAIASMARNLGVDEVTLGAAIRGKTWKSVPMLAD